MPKFQENTGFKLPGLGSKEKDTPGNFREDQGVENVGWCDTTDYHMLPKGSSPLLATEEPKDWLVPDYYHTTYTGSSWPTRSKKGKKEKVEEGEEPKTPEAKINTPEYNPNLPNVDLTVPDLTSKGGDNRDTAKFVNRTTTAAKEVYTPPKITEEGTAAYNALTPEQRKAQDEKYKRLNTKIIPGETKEETTYECYGKICSEKEWKKIRGQ